MTHSGLVTAVGMNAPASLAAIRAGVSGNEEVNLWDYESGEYITGGRVPLPQWWESIEKDADLVAPAILECLRAAEPLSLEEVPVLIGVSFLDRPLRPNDLDHQIMKLVGDRLGGPLHPASRAIARGRCSGLVALHESRGLLSSGSPACIVAGVDSFLDRGVAREYFKRHRLLTPSNSDGFVPGEAGSAVLVQESIGPGLEILGIGFGHEPVSIESDEPFEGIGLLQAVRGALEEAGLTIFDAAYRITDLNGEQYKFKEALFTTMRLETRRREELFDLWHPIEYIGDVGGAIGPCVLALALDAGEQQYAPGPVALCHFSNDNGERAAAIVRYPPGDAQ